MMDILVTGASGQLGSELKRMLAEGKSELGELPPCYKVCSVTAVDADVLDITDAKAVDQYLYTHNFSILFNCAAMTNVDACESDEETAYRVNAEGPGNLAASCRMYGCRLVHVSTDYVFCGDTETPYTEKDVPDPGTAYGRTKLAGERLVLEADPEAIVCRTAWLYGGGDTNFPRKILRLARERGVLKVVTDQKGDPTNAADLAYEMVRLAAAKEKGVFHCTCGGGPVSRFEFAAAVLKEAGIPCRLEPCLTEDFPRVAKVPACSGLSKAKLDSIHMDFFRDWKVALHAWMTDCTMEG